MTTNSAPTIAELREYRTGLEAYCSTLEGHDFDVAPWADRLASLRDHIERRPEVPVALLGGTGAGKSSLLNALLGERLLSTSSSEACTSAITEVAFAEGRYSGTVEFISRDEWTRELGQLEQEMADAREQGNIGEGGNYDFGISKVARDKLASLYGDSADEYELSLNRNHLVESPELSKAFALGSVTFEAPDMRSFAKELEQYVSSRKMYWPIVKKVRVDGPFDALVDGAVVVDLPGLNDPNAAREAATREHLQRAQFVWVVFNMKRALTRDITTFLTEDDLLRRLYMDGRVGQISFVGTHSDGIDFDADTERYDLDEDCETIEIVKARNANVEVVVHDQLRDLANEIARAAGESPERVDQLRSQLAEAPVFCTSSHDYMLVKGIAKRGNKTIDTAVDTQVPALAEHLANLARNLGMSSHIDGLRHDLLILRRDMVHAIELKKAGLEAAQAVSGTQLEEVRAAASQAATFLEDRTNRATDRVSSSIENAQIELTERLDQAILDAQENFTDLPKVWRATAWNTLKATARRGGSFAGSVKRCDIPRDISKPLLDGVSVAWVDFFGITASNTIEFAANTLEDGVADYIERFQNDTFGKSDELDDAIATQAEAAFTISQDLVFDRTDEMKVTVKDRLSKDRQQLTSAVEQQIASAMEPAFAKAAEESGSGMHARMVDILESGLKQATRQMFDGVRQVVNTGLTDLRGFMVDTTESTATDVRTEAGSFADAVLSSADEHLESNDFQDVIDALAALLAGAPGVLDETPILPEHFEAIKEEAATDSSGEPSSETAAAVVKETSIQAEAETVDESAVDEVQTHWFEDFVMSGDLARRVPRRMDLDEEFVAKAVLALEDQGGSMTVEAFASTLDVSRPRAVRSVAVLAQILNVDGYEVISKDETLVSLDSALLERQFSAG